MADNNGLVFIYSYTACNCQRIVNGVGTLLDIVSRKAVKMRYGYLCMIKCDLKFETNDF